MRQRFVDALRATTLDLLASKLLVAFMQEGSGTEKMAVKRTSKCGSLGERVAKLLRELIGERKSGLLFRTRTGQQLHQSNILRRVLHPILEELGQPKCDVHAFRRFRNTYLRNYTSTPPGVYRFWMGGCN